MADFINHEELGEFLAEAIDELEAKRKFAGDLEIDFVVPLEDGTEYLVRVARKVDDAE